MHLLGYTYLIDFNLPALPLARVCRLSGAIPNRRIRDQGGQKVEEFGPTYAPNPTMVGHLRFALRYEGLNLKVLSLLFERVGGEDIQSALNLEPTGAAPRRLAFLYEWLTGRALEMSVRRLNGKTRFVPALLASVRYRSATLHRHLTEEDRADWYWINSFWYRWDHRPG